MEKLIELLNEYNEGGHWRDENFDANKLLVISKKYGFIKWLVDNDKIDYDKAKVHHLWKERYSNYESILMKLAISDTPIEDLCRYLKDDATEEVDTLLKGIKKSCESLGI